MPEFLSWVEFASLCVIGIIVGVLVSWRLGLRLLMSLVIAAGAVVLCAVLVAGGFTLALVYGDNSGLTATPQWVDPVATGLFAGGAAVLVFGLAVIVTSAWLKWRIPRA